jgi:cell division protein FtsQ
MWDNPRLLNASANLLIGVALALLAMAGAQLLLRSSWFELREVTVLGAPTHTGGEQIRRATQAALSGANFLAVDIDAVRGALEQLPWVRRVELRRVWPDRLEISLEEHVAFAHWGDAGLVNTHGEFFAGTQRRVAAVSRRSARHGGRGYAALPRVRADCLRRSPMRRCASR